MFISAFGPEDEDGREIGFAHFHQETGDLPTLRVLGWDGDDTVLKLEHVASTLRERLHWPEKGESLDQWRERWARAFRHRIGHIIRTSSELAEAMAILARRIHGAAHTLLQHESERGPLTKLFKAFRAALIHDLTEDGFADTYAQTITYGLLIAAIHRTDMSGSTEATYVKADDLTGIVRVTSPFIKELLETFLKVGGRKGGIDFDELGIQDVVELLRGQQTDLPAIVRDFGNKSQGEDPVIHFYQHFLESYNKKLRIQRGVFYTPQPVVSYIVRSVHELLQSEFGLEDGLASTITWGEMIKKSNDRSNNRSADTLVRSEKPGGVAANLEAADKSVHAPLKLPPLTDSPGETRTISPDEPFVQILDIATGTATFIVETIDLIHKHLQAKWKSSKGILPLNPGQQGQDALATFKTFAAYWNDYVPKHLLPRVYGYELMMAPYVIAHLKVGLN